MNDFVVSLVKTHPHDVLHPTPRSALYAFAIPLHVEPGLHVNRDKNGVMLKLKPRAELKKLRRQPASDPLGAISTKTAKTTNVNFILGFFEEQILHY